MKSTIAEIRGTILNRLSQQKDWGNQEAIDMINDVFIEKLGESIESNSRIKGNCPVCHRIVCDCIERQMKTPYGL